MGISVQCVIYSACITTGSHFKETTPLIIIIIIIIIITNYLLEKVFLY